MITSEKPRICRRIALRMTLRGSRAVYVVLLFAFRVIYVKWRISLSDGSGPPVRTIKKVPAPLSWCGNFPLKAVVEAQLFCVVTIWLK